MTDIDSLTKNLTQIVGSLMHMIEKGGSDALLPAGQGIKRTNDMTYHDFLENVLKNRAPLPVIAKKQSYRLQEDIEILYYLSSHTTISGKTFDEMAESKRINRTAESLKSRYHDHIHKIQEK